MARPIRQKVLAKAPSTRNPKAAIQTVLESLRRKVGVNIYRQFALFHSRYWQAFIPLVITRWLL
jgi:hypothetical protein